MELYLLDRSLATVENATVRLFGKDRTPYVRLYWRPAQGLFVGIIAFKNFGTFTLEGHLLGSEGQKPPAEIE